MSIVSLNIHTKCIQCERALKVLFRHGFLYSFYCRYVGVVVKMKWTCKYCTSILFHTTKKEVIIQHYKLKHGHHGRTCPLPCIYQECVCSFRTRAALKRHLLGHHEKSVDNVNTRVKCNHCSFSEACNLKLYFSHLGIHLKNNETVHCPFQDCSFQTRVFSMFASHRSRSHRLHTSGHFKADFHAKSKRLRRGLYREMINLRTAYHLKGICTQSSLVHCCPVQVFLSRT